MIQAGSYDDFEADIAGRALSANDDDERGLVGTVAVVTGAGRGLGREVARRLAAQGAALGIAARRGEELEETVRLIEAGGGTVSAFALDVSDEAAVQNLVDTVQRDMGPVDLLVNNAAVVAPLGPIWECHPPSGGDCLRSICWGPSSALELCCVE